MAMLMTMRLEIHDSECRDCAAPKPGDGYELCPQCRIENASLGALGEPCVLGRLKEIEADRAKRRRENGR